MPKRKLSDLTDTNATANQDSQPSQNRTSKIQLTRLKQKFEYGVTTLSRALKAARGFERQKLGRRQKSAKDDRNAETLKRIEEEIKVLKGLDPATTAEKYLFKQLVKTKRITEASLFVRFRQSKKISVEGPKSTEEANVTARLFKSNPVKNVLPGIMDGLKSLFGLEEPTRKKDDLAKTKGNKEDGKGGKADRRRVPTVSDEESEDDDGQDRRDVDMDDDDAESSEGDYAEFDARLAPLSDEDEDADGGDNGLSDEDLAPTTSKHPLPRSDMSISLSPSLSPEPSPPKKQKPSQKTTATHATSTTFLPSLMMGGYWSGSESEAETEEEAPKRKNRMGQQARRALWEKKYGARANHLKQQNEKKKGKNSRDSGWDPRKGATGDGDSGRRRFGTGSNATSVNLDKRLERGRTEKAQGAGKKKPQDDKPLHPSWEAARKAKEQKTTASYQGKKVVFD